MKKRFTEEQIHSILKESEAGSKKNEKSGIILKNQRSVLTALNELREKENIHWNHLDIIEFSLKEETRTSVKEFYLEYLI